MASATIRLPAGGDLTMDEETYARAVAVLDAFRARGLDAGNGRILHRRPRGRRPHRGAGIVGCGGPRLRHLFQRRQDGDDRRARGDARRPWGRERGDRPRHGRGRAEDGRRGCRGGHHRRGRAGRSSAATWAPSRRARAATATSSTKQGKGKPPLKRKNAPPASSPIILHPHLSPYTYRNLSSPPSP